jgi:hypothetical protein
MFFAFAFLFTASVSCEGGEKRTTAKNKSRKFLFEKSLIRYYKQIGYSRPFQKTRTKNKKLKDCITDEHGLKKKIYVYPVILSKKEK